MVKEEEVVKEAEQEAKQEAKVVAKDEKTLIKAPPLTVTAPTSPTEEFVPGPYKLLMKAGVTPDITWSKDFTEVLPKGTLVHILEVKTLEETHTVRGRLKR